MSNSTLPAKVGSTDQLGLLVNRALFADECERLAEWALIGPVQRAALESFAERLLAVERERWQRIATNAQAVTTGCEDKIDHFEVPSHLMAALALALDEGPNHQISGACVR